MVWSVVAESVDLFVRMSPYLLFGFLFAGLLHVFVSLDMIARHLGRSNLWSVIKAVILGIPLPLCSCGVIPAAVALRQKGASRGAVMSFLIATPITGVDSILATYSLLGLFFTIARIVASCVTALVAGVLGNVLLAPDHIPEEFHTDPNMRCEACEPVVGDGTALHARGPFSELFRYAFVELLGDIWKWLLIGVLIGGVIAAVLPGTFIEQYLGSGWQAMLLMLIIGIPMYVCSTGSIPIAAALMLKGLSPGAALVFLLAGPATNAVTITVVSKELGRGATVLYVASIAVMSVLMGMLLNALWGRLGELTQQMLHPMAMLPKWFEQACALLLAALIVIAIVRRIARHKGNGHNHDHCCH